MVRRGFKTTVIATVIAMMLSPNFSALAQTGKSNTLGSWKLENNAWVFLDGEGKQVKGWVVYNQEWYYMNPENGQLKMGWLQLDGKWYFLSTEAGAMQGRLLTGWQWIDGYCYYFYGNDDSRYGELLVNGRTPDGYYVNQSGHWLQGEGGEAVYEAGRGLSSAASEQQVAGASRALPGQVLGASRAIAAPGGGSFGGGGGGGSTGGGGTTASVSAPAAGTTAATAPAQPVSPAQPATPDQPETEALVTPTQPKTETPVTPVQPETEAPVTPAQPETEAPVTPAQPETETPVIPTQPETEAPVTPAQPETEAPVTPTQPETENPVTPTQPEKPVEDFHKEEENLKEWPFEYRFEYDAEKKSFLLFFGENEDTKLVKEFLSRNVEVMVNDSHYELGDWTDDLRDAENKYIYALKWDIKERGYYNALRLARSAFHEGDNTVEFAPDGYKPLVFNFKVKRGMLQELKKLEKLQYHFEEKVLTGSYNVKIVKFEKLSAEQKACITGLKTLEVDGVSYTKVEDQRYEDLCADGRHAFMILNGTSDLAIGNPPKEYATHKISLHPEGYEDIEITYEKLENEPAPLRRKLEKKPGYYELSFQGSREDIQAYLTNIKKLTVAEREFGQMASFHTDLLSMGEKYTFGDSEGKKKVEDLLLFSVPTANVDKKQEIRIESEGYELNIIPLS